MVKTANNSITGVILAGGHSRRMGQNKALMSLGDDPLIVHVIRQMQSVTDKLLLITNTPDRYAHLNVPMRRDVVPNTGALGGIYTGLTCAENDTILCVACDMPLLQPELLIYLISISEGYDATVPCVEEVDGATPKFQTLSAVYAQGCVPVIDRMLAEGELRIHVLYDRISVRIVKPPEWQRFDPQGLSFFNINTPEDFEEAKRVLYKQNHYGLNEVCV